METSLRVPIITPDDLCQFHARCFGKPFHSIISADRESSCKTEDFAEDCGLGRYDNGVQRTLTDGQIAMFRHSEIQALLREQRHEKERTGSEYKSVPRSKELTDGAWGLQEVGDGVGSEDGEIEDKEEENEEEEYAKFLQDERKKFESAAACHRRSGRNGMSLDNRAISTRRRVRELDSVVREDQLLVYDDEPSPVPDVRSLGTTDAATKSVTGKSFWWPLIGS